MLPALGAASSAVDALKSLTSSSSSSAQPAGGFAQFDIFGSMRVVGRLDRGIRRPAAVRRYRRPP